MPTPVSIFLEFNLPNATTWFFFSFLLAIALFFKFSRILSVRNLDVVMMFLLVPGLLIVQASRPRPGPVEQHPATQLAVLIGQEVAPAPPIGHALAVARFTAMCGPTLERMSWQWFGYLWLMIGSLYFFCRCLLDLTLVQRPALAPNLQIGGLAWLGGALLVCLLAVAYRQVDQQMRPSAGGAEPVSMFQSPDTTFAVAALWRDWPAWAIAVLAFAGHIAVVIGLVLVGWRHFQDPAAGMAAATFYLLLPYTGFYVGQVQHVLPMALFLGTILAYRQPTLTGILLGIATAATYFPALALPVWVSFYRQRGTGRFLFAFLLTTAAVLGYIGLTFWVNRQLESSIDLAMSSAAWQPWASPGNAEGFWNGVPWAYRIPIFLLFLSFVLVTTFWPSPKNLAHVIALSAAAFIGMQWWCAEQGGVYVLWYVPLMLLLVFRPNLQERVAPQIIPETDWLMRTWAWCARLGRRVLKMPEAPAKSNAA
ncbi:MAG TPA: hypothetical protein VFE62_29110 [Gemmataceae bacterium]|nr:hypothetical protein [Gemmataceae bacterium]